MRLNFLFHTFFFFPLFVLSQTLTDNLQKTFARFERDSQLRYSVSSLTVLNAETGEVVFSRNPEVGMSPASTLKLITSATAFHLLGSDYTFQTTLSYNGVLTDRGTLNGDVIIQSNGDPALGSDRYDRSRPALILERWVLALRKAGIKQIQGRIIANDSLFGTQTIPIGWIWQDIGNYYGAGSSSVCWNENQFDIIFQPGSMPGAPVQLVSTMPAVPYLKLVNEVTTGSAGSGDNVYAYSAPYSDVVYLRGTYAIDLKKKVSASLPDPAYEAAFRLKESLAKAGIAVSGDATTCRRLSMQQQPVKAVQRIADTYVSPPLSQLIYWFNRKSINLYGENMVKTFALKAQKEASTEAGVEVIQNFWNKKLNVDKNSLNILDGSGLSPENRVTTLAMSKILLAAREENWFADFYESLPEYNQMKMKSGTMRNVLAYAGYHRNKRGQKFVFAFIVNNYNGSTSAIRQKMFHVLDELK